MGKEALVQSAIIAALEVYGDRHQIHTALHTPYANQQGAQLHRLAGDIVGRLAQSTLLLLEVKELDSTTTPPSLPAYDVIQHADNIHLEAVFNVPILYAYADPAQMPYLDIARTPQWPAATLHRTRISRPTLLNPIALPATSFPDIGNHGTLLEWLMFPQRNSTSALLEAWTLLGMGIESLKNIVVILVSNSGDISAIPAGAVHNILREVSRNPEMVLTALGPEHAQDIDVGALIKAAKKRARELNKAQVEAENELRATLKSDGLDPEKIREAIRAARAEEQSARKDEAEESIKQHNEMRKAAAAALKTTPLRTQPKPGRPQ